MDKIEINGKVYDIKVVRNHLPMNIEEEIIDGIVNAVYNDGNYSYNRFEYFFYSSLLGYYTDFDIENSTAEELLEIIDCNLVRPILEGLNPHDGLMQNQVKRIRESSLNHINALQNESPLKKLGNDLHILLTCLNGLIEGTDSTELMESINKLLNSESFVETIKNYIK